MYCHDMETSAAIQSKYDPNFISVKYIKLTQILLYGTGITEKSDVILDGYNCLL